MQIDKIGQNRAQQVQQTDRADAAASAPRETREVKKAASDELHLSERAKELQAARQAVEEAPDVREDRVAAIKQAIADGTYRVSPDEIARKLLG